MALERFKLGSLVDLDGGRISAAFEHALARLEADCKDRPGVKDARKLELHVTVTPVIDQGGELESCNLQFRISDKVPKRQSKVYNMSAGRSGLYWNELSAEDARQMTIDDARGPRPVAIGETVDSETGEVTRAS